jgi:Protein of unknown function (DUF3987)
MSTYNITEHTFVLTPVKGSRTKYHCPVCNGHNLDIKPSTGAYNCFSGGCDSKDIRAAIDRLEGKPEWKPEQDNWVKPIRPKSRKDYFYPNRDGNPLIKVERIDPGDGTKKTFPQYHWTGSRWETGNPKEIRHLIPIYRYREVRQAIGRGELVFWVEGEATADLLWELGIAATTTLGGSGAYSDYGNYQADLAGAQIVPTPDRDCNGLKYIANIERDFFSQIEGYYLAGTQGLWQNPQGGMDIGDDICDHNLTKEQILAKIIPIDAIGNYIDSKRQHSPQNEDEENTQFLQVKLGNLLEIKGKKAPQIFQDDLGISLQAIANNFNIPLEILVFCLLPILSARIPSETRLLINPGTDYSVPALRWSALIGETGTKKSPVLKALLAPLLKIQKNIAAKYKTEKDVYDQEYNFWKTEKVDKRGEEPTPPVPMLDCYFSDFTIESIGQSISARPDDSYLVFVDELAGFFKSMDAYRKGGGDRQKWLDLYNAGALKINRKGSPTIFCPHTSVSILGGLQPSVLAQMIKDDSSAEDGLWNRFMFCRLPQTKTDAFSHNSVSLFECLLALYTNLSSAPVIEHTLSDAAKTLWKVWHDDVEDKVMVEASELLRGTYAKAEGIAGRNALIVHRAIAAQQGVIPELAISGEVMTMAIEWTQWELGQTLLEYQRLGLTEDPELSRILRFIDKFEGKGWVNAVAVRPWWSGKVKPPVQEIRSFMTKVVTLGSAIDNGEAPTSGKYQILIDRKGSHVSHVLPESGSGKDIESVTTLSHKISQSGDETATQSQIQNMTTVSHKVSHVLANGSTTRTESENSECRSSNMTKNMTNGSHVSKPADLRHPVDLPAQNMTNGSHDLKSLLVNDCSENMTNMTTFSSDRNTSDLANIESIAVNLADLVELPEGAAKNNPPPQTLLKGDRVKNKQTQEEGVITTWARGRTKATIQFDNGDLSGWMSQSDLVLVNRG